MCKCSFAAKKLQLFPLYEETSHIFQPLMSHFSFSYSLIDSLSSRDPLIKVTKLHQPFFESFDVLRHAFRRFKMQQIMMNNFLLGQKLWEKVMGVYNGGVACSLLKLGILEKTIIASLFYSGWHSGTIFCGKNDVICYIGERQDTSFFNKLCQIDFLITCNFFCSNHFLARCQTKVLL